MGIGFSGVWDFLSVETVSVHFSISLLVSFSVIYSTPDILAGFDPPGEVA